MRACAHALAFLAMLAPLCAQDPAAGTPVRFVEPAGVYRYAFDLPDRAPGYRVAVKSYLDDLDPKAVPAFSSRTPEIRMSAARGEYEPAAFVIYATRDLESVELQPTNLACGKSIIPASELELRRVVRTPLRRVYTAPVGKADIVGRFLPRWQRAGIPKGELREIWLTVHVPESTSPGDYTGRIAIRSGATGESIPIAMRVHSFELKENPQKGLGIYYRPRGVPETRVRTELRDMYAHGVRHLVSGVQIGYRKDGASFAPDYTDVRRCLQLAGEAGFHGTVVVGAGLLNLARTLGHKDAISRAHETRTGESLDGPRGDEFRRVAKVSMEGFKKLQAEFPRFRLVLTDMDEVFNEGRLPLYIRLTKAAQQVPGLKFYITFHTRDEQADEMRKQIDPYVDIRCYHGFTVEWWLARGHSIAEMKRELAASGDEAWFYHNVRGTYFTARWARIINGFYLWASPFTTHAPWIYQAYISNPFDDADNERVDFGMSFPGPTDPADLVPTRIWECMREGYDDLRYIATLQDSIRARKSSRPKEAASAQAFLDKIESLFDLRTAQPRTAGGGPGDPVDPETGLRVRKTIGTAEEAPLIHAVDRRFTGNQWEAMRRELVRHILALR